VRIFDSGANVPDLKNFGEYRLTYRTGDIVSPKIDPAEPLALEIQYILLCGSERRRPALVDDGRADVDECSKLWTGRLTAAVSPVASRRRPAPTVAEGLVAEVRRRAAAARPVGEARGNGEGERLKDAETRAAIAQPCSGEHASTREADEAQPGRFAQEKCRYEQARATCVSAASLPEARARRLLDITTSSTVNYLSQSPY